MPVQTAPFGTVNQTPVSLFTLTNRTGVTVKITNFGGIITEIHAPDRRGHLADVVLGFSTLADYAAGHPFFGCVVGRFANRIAGGRFTLDGQTIQLAVNSGPNHIHGGVRGFDKVVWQAEAIERAGAAGVRLRHVSPDGNENYPGNLSVQVDYTLTDDNALRIDYQATTDAPTIVNLTNHTYFNLSGQAGQSIEGHRLQLDATHFTPVNQNTIPTGELRPVQGTPFDFTAMTAIGARIDLPNEQLHIASGYDHNWVLNHAPGKLGHAATVVEPESGRMLTVLTTQPGVQFYTGNNLPEKVVGKAGTVYRKRGGFCLETQHFPDSPNQPNFPSVVLRPNETYRHTTIFQFSAAEG